jgi:hypothetical protein
MFEHMVNGKSCDPSIPVEEPEPVEYDPDDFPSLTL